jgi:phospholipase/carboxylesterase
MPAWYDISALDIDRAVDKEQLVGSAEQVRLLVEREVDRGIPSNRIVVAGFSQGGAVAYQLALTHMYPLAGLLCLSTYFATGDSITPNAANRQIPIKICHGTADPMVSVQLGKRACRQLEDMGYAVDYSEYPMEHAVCPAEIADISRWLQAVLACPIRTKTREGDIKVRP